MSTRSDRLAFWLQLNPLEDRLAVRRREAMRLTRDAPTVLLAICCFGAGIMAATLASDRGDRTTASAAGACVGLDMTAAHVPVEELTRLRVIRALTSVMNPYRDSFPATTSVQLRTCDAVRAHRFPGALGSH